MNRMCELAGVSRAGFYRSRAPAPPTKPDEPLRMQIREIALQWPAYGSRRITAELRERGWVINRKRVQRLMRLMGLESVAPKPNTISVPSVKARAR